MTCHSSRVPITPMSVIQVTSPARRKRRQARGTRRPAVLSRTARAAIEPSTSATPSTIAASFSVVGVVMKRVSTSMRADSAGCDGHLEVGEDARDLRLLLRREGSRGAGDSDEVGAHLPDVGPDVQNAAVARGDGGPRCGCRHRVAERDEHGVGVGADEQRALGGVVGLPRHCGQHDAAFGGQRGDGLAGNGDVEGLRRPRHQRRGDVGDHAVGAGCLRPVDGGGRLLDGQQRDQRAQHHSCDSRDDGDDPGDGRQPGRLGFVAWHEGRC